MIYLSIVVICIAFIITCITGLCLLNEKYKCCIKLIVFDLFLIIVSVVMNQISYLN